MRCDAAARFVDDDFGADETATIVVAAQPPTEVAEVNGTIVNHIDQLARTPRNRLMCVAKDDMPGNGHIDSMIAGTLAHLAEAGAEIAPKAIANLRPRHEQPAVSCRLGGCQPPEKPSLDPFEKRALGQPAWA